MSDEKASDRIDYAITGMKNFLCITEGRPQNINIDICRYGSSSLDCISSPLGISLSLTLFSHQHIKQLLPHEHEHKQEKRNSRSSIRVRHLSADFWGQAPIAT